jgi:type III secretory pathway component EscU
MCEINYSYCTYYCNYMVINKVIPWFIIAVGYLCTVLIQYLFYREQ